MHVLYREIFPTVSLEDRRSGTGRMDPVLALVMRDSKEVLLGTPAADAPISVRVRDVHVLRTEAHRHVAYSPAPRQVL